jgi:hypothetical protein
MTFAATVTNAALADVGIIDVQGKQRIGFEVAVTTNTLNGFSILGRFHASGGYLTLYSVTADYTSPTGLLVGTSGDLTLQAVGSGWFIMDTTGLESVKIQAKSGNAGGSTVTLKGLTNNG